MSIDADKLYALLPAIYRIRDQGEGEPLRQLLSVIAEQIAGLQDNIDQLYDDQFIETCAEWVVPYIGDLVGYRQLHGGNAQVRSPRAEVADTIRLRRGKGTAATLELLARDVTGWPTHVAEFFRNLATTQYMNHLRPDNIAMPRLRSPVEIGQIGGAFDRFNYTADIRRAASGRFNIPNVGIHLWRLRDFSLSASPAFALDSKRFLFNPLGISAPLFTRPKARTEGVSANTALNIPAPISRLDFAAAKADYYGASNSVLVEGVGLDQLVICNLADIADGVWAHVAPPGKVAVDPVLGRIAFGAAPAAPPKVTFCFGAPGAIGGGEYGRTATFDIQLAPVNAVPGQSATLKKALAAVAGGGAVEIGDNQRYAEKFAVKIAAGKRAELRAADLKRALLALNGEMTINGETGSGFSVNGLLISGAAVRITKTGAAAALAGLKLQHCTLVPGLDRNGDGSPAQPGEPSLVVEAAAVVEIDHCILGGLRVSPDATVTIKNSIIDATGPGFVAFSGLDGRSPGGTLVLQNCTIVGKVHASQIDANGVIFLAETAAGDGWAAPVWTERRQAGQVRYSFLPQGSRVPRPFQCQPSAPSEAARVRPVFTSLRYGDPGYGQLSRRTASENRHGSEDGDAIGAFHNLFEAQRETNLRVRLDEYLRYGLEAGLIFAT